MNTQINIAMILVIINIFLALIIAGNAWRLW